MTISQADRGPGQVCCSQMLLDKERRAFFPGLGKIYINQINYIKKGFIDFIMSTEESTSFNSVPVSKLGMSTACEEV